MYVLCRLQVNDLRIELRIWLRMELMEGVLQKPNLASGGCRQLLRCRHLTSPPAIHFVNIKVNLLA